MSEQAAVDVSELQAKISQLEAEVNKQKDNAQTWMGKATHYEKTLNGKDPIALIEAAKERDLLAQQAAVGDPKKFESELERRAADIRKEFAPQLENKDKELSGVKSKLKDLLIVDKVYSKASDKVYPKAAEDFKNYVRAVCDLDENEEIIIKDSQGKVRYSPNNASKPMSVDELIAELTESRDHWFTNPVPKGGKMEGDKSAGGQKDWTLESLARLSDSEQRKVLAEMPEAKRKELVAQIKF